MGAWEWALIPGVFPFCLEGKVIAMLACHVDDIHMIGHPEQAKPIWEKLKAKFNFGEWPVGLLHKMIGSSFKDDMKGNWLITRSRSRWTTTATQGGVSAP